MIRLLFFLSIIMYCSHNYASQALTIKPSYRDITRRNNHVYEEQCLKLQQSKIPIKQNKAAPSANICYNFDNLPQDTQSIILWYATNNTSAKTPTEATQIVRTLLFVNKYSNAFINRPIFRDNLIKDLALKYHCSHQTIAQKLHVKKSKKKPTLQNKLKEEKDDLPPQLNTLIRHRLILQNKLKNLCCAKEDDNLLLQLNTLISQGADLEFTYNDKGFPLTPLMITMKYQNNMFEYLLDHGANINGTNSMRISALHVAISDPINENYCMQLITHPTIAINHQNSRGETALLRCLTRKKDGSTNRVFIKIIEELLKNGANAQLTDKFGLAPLAAAQQLGKKTIINIIQKAIEAQHTQKL